MQTPPLQLTITFPYRTSGENWLLYFTDLAHTAVCVSSNLLLTQMTSPWLNTASFYSYRTSSAMPKSGLTLWTSILTSLTQWSLKKKPWAFIFWWVNTVGLVDISKLLELRINVKILVLSFFQSCKEERNPCKSFSCSIPPADFNQINATFRVWRPTFIKVRPSRSSFIWTADRDLSTCCSIKTHC